MKFIASILAVVTLLTGFTFGEPAAPKTKYVVGMTGITCAGCKQHVRTAFATLKGVSKDSINIQSEGDEQKVTFESSDATITKEQAVKSLGDMADTYIVKTLKIEGAPAGGGKGEAPKKEEKKS